MNKEYVYFVVCIIVAGLFTYGQYFVATIELQKFQYQLTAMLWVLLGLIITILIKVEILTKKLSKVK